MFQTFDATTRPEQGPPRLAALRAEMAGAGLAGFLVPRADAHQGEYVSAHDERLAWLTGFGGSAGSAATGRLAEDGSRSVCLLEAGGRNNNVLVKTPGFMPFLLKNANYRFETVPQKGLNGRIGYRYVQRLTFIRQY